ncbi:MAG TPA: LuxR C-terminal-related transcriptional regulator [Terriglobales bacterium]|nr:LuxR C-terminal-related transcriptional regulator [Terriglobales bacterium]
MLDSEVFALLENTADAAFTVSEQGEIRSWNKAAEGLFGFSAKEALGRTCYQVLEGMGPLGTQVCHENCSVLECAGGKGQIPNFDLNVRVRSGERIWVNMSTLVYVNQRTGHRLLIHLAHDITEQKKTEQLVQKIRSFSRQLDEEEALPLGRPAPAIALSDQEKQILRFFAEGKETEQITQLLGISAQTVRNHLHHINQKLRTHNRLEAVMHAIQRKLI